MSSKTKCEGHNRCYLLARELFDVDDMGMAFDNCPEFAIVLIETDDTNEPAAEATP